MASHDKKRQDTVLAIAVIALGLLVIFVWIPNDIETGVIYKLRRITMIGDSFAPTFAGCLLLLSGILLMLERRQASPGPALALVNLRFCLLMLAIFVVTVILMRWSGPVAVHFLDAGSYRSLRNTVPWKYIGFILGGSFFVTAVSGMLLHRIGPRTILFAIACAIVLAMLYDAPFGDLLLPPNGDTL